MALTTKSITKVETTTKTVSTDEKPINPLRIKDTGAFFNWTVIGLDDCEYTKQAIALLKLRDENYKYIPLNAEWHRRLVVEHGTRRIPAVFRGATYFGCLQELEGYYKCSFVADSERF